MSSEQVFAIIPAAGHSQRMGRPKLLLPWKGRTMLDHVLEAWTSSRVSHVIVVIRSRDAALLEICQRWPVEVVQPQHDPRDMKESVQFGLRHVSAAHRPSDNDCWLLAPADLPGINTRLINQLIAVQAGPASIVVPRFGLRRGHPLRLPWSLTPEVLALRDGGIDRLVTDRSTMYVDFPADEALDDVDTPADYGRWLADGESGDG